MRVRCLRLLLSGAIFALVAFAMAFPAAAAPRDLSAYPLKVHIYQNHWSGGECCGYKGYGRANVIDGADAHGMEYTFSCLEHFMASDADENYPARWKKQGQTIEMVMGVIGSPDKTRTCELKVSLKDSVFIKTDGELKTISLAEYHERQASRAASRAALAPSDTDAAHYPMRLSVLAIGWGSPVAGMRSGSGQGNLDVGGRLSSVDFSASCPVKFEVTPEGRYYRAQWKTDGAEMAILLRKIGDPTQNAVCELKTTVHTDVYVRGANGELKAVSADVYKTMAKGPATTEAAP